MDYKELSMAVIDAMEDICYISDPVTYELLFLNRAGRKAFRLEEKKIEIGDQKCYQLLQSREEPCEFCTNHLLKQGNCYCWNNYNTTLGRYYELRDTLLKVDGREVRMEICKDITENEIKVERLKKKLSVEETVMKCVQILTEELDMQEAIDHLLSVVGNYYRAERAYIFEFYRAEGITRNTYEWCREGISPEIDGLQNVPLEAIDRWVEQFSRTGEIFITSLNGEVDRTSMEYQFLEPQGIERLMAAPMRKEGEIVGFIGVDNPSEDIQDTLLLQSITFFVLEELYKRRLLQELEELSFVDALTGVGNRNRYIHTLNEIGKAPSKELGIIYADVNGLKAANDTYGHAFGDCVIKRAADTLKKFFDGMVFRIGGDEFVVICEGIKQECFEKKVKALREQVKQEQFGISVGFSWKADCVDALCQIKEADSQMYQDKRNYHDRCAGKI